MLHLKNTICIVSLCSMLLSGCGGGGDATPSSSGGTKPNAAPTLVATPTLLNLESGQAAQVMLSASDDDGAPVLSVSSTSANLSAELAADGKVLTVTARTVTSNEKGSVVLVATESNAAKKQTTQSIEVDIFPKLALFTLVNGVRQQSALNAEYAKPLIVSVVDEQNQLIPVSTATSADPAILQVQKQGSVLTLHSLKTGSTQVELTGTAASGLQYRRTIAVNTVGNQQPSLKFSAASLSVEENIEATVIPVITDPDGSALKNGVLSVVSASPAIATAVMRAGELIVTGVKTGSTTLTLRLVDGEFSVTASLAVSVIPEVLPEISINQNVQVELEEQQSLAVPISISGARAASYVPSVNIVSVDGQLSDLSYNVSGNTLNLTAGALTLVGGRTRVSFTMTASATNGRHTVKSAPVQLQLMLKLNAPPIFEWPNRFRDKVMIKRSGITQFTINVRDDVPSRVVIAAPQPSSNTSKAGTYTMTYDDKLRQLTLDLTGFEVNEEFALSVSYQDVDRGGSQIVNFRTYELSDNDLRFIAARNTAIAKLEAARSYQLIGKLYAEYLQNIGVLDAQAVDEFYDQLKIDDTVNSQFSTAEFFIGYYMEQLYNNDFNSGKTSVTSAITSLQQYVVAADELNRSSINKINELAEKSNGYFPSLSFENSINEVTPTQYSKFYGKAAYGSFINGEWQYAPAYRFLGAIDAKVYEKTAARVQ